MEIKMQVSIYVSLSPAQRRGFIRQRSLVASATSLDGTHPLETPHRPVLQKWAG
jgi:hypothetical protein